MLPVTDPGAEGENMRKSKFALAMILAALPTITLAQKPSAYPAKNQSAEQQSTDDTQCLAWAKQSTGIDPATFAAPPPTGPQGERLRGAARGAAGGAVIGELVDGDSSKGAGVGAAAGVLAGGVRARHNRAAQAQSAQASQQQQAGTYYHAYGACMQGRGYTTG
jgi:hypothetical protein